MNGIGRHLADAAQLTVRDLGGYRVTLAGRDFAGGEVVFPVEGPAQTRPERHTVQIAGNSHVRCNVGSFVNHSCRPNCRFDAGGMAFVALRAIAAGEEVTFDYNTTEYELHCPFQCRCGSADCVGLVRGYRYLPAGRRRLIAPLAAPHLLRLAAAET